MEVRICGEVFSENLGDGVIAVSLRYLMRMVSPDAKVEFIDLSGRQAFNSVGVVARRSFLHRGYDRLVSNGGTIGSAIAQHVWAVRRRRAASVKWRGQLRGADLLVIGGGQLLMDNGTFPARLDLAAQFARSEGVRVAVHACGVGSRWSRGAIRRLRRTLDPDSLVSISTRDSDSAIRLAALAPSLAERIYLTADPAVCASDAFGITRSRTSAVIGLGVVAPDELRRRLPTGVPMDEQRLVRFWLELAGRLSSAGHCYTLFTNGSRRDHDFAQELATALEMKGARSSGLLAVRPERPRELVETIAGYRAIVAYRLHANIIAASLGVPCVGLVWDPKVLQFFRQIGREDVCLDGSDPSAVEVDQALAKQIAIAGASPFNGVDHLKRMAERDVAALLSHVDGVHRSTPA